MPNIAKLNSCQNFLNLEYSLEAVQLLIAVIQQGIHEGVF